MISTPVNNDLLAALPPRERYRVLELSEQVALARDEILGEPGARIRHVYFPIDSSIALVSGSDPHDSLGVGMIGSEGMLGAALVLGVRDSPLQARVQGAGNAHRLTAADFQNALRETPILELQLRRYVHVLFAQLAQTAVCTAFHRVEVRLANWLLMAHDRAHGDRFYVTHDRLAHLLGVRRSGVSTAAGVLQGHKLIRYTRGHIVVLNRKGLEQAACVCHAMERDALKQIAPSIAPQAGQDEIPAGGQRRRPRDGNGYGPHPESVNRTGIGAVGHRH